MKPQLQTYDVKSWKVMGRNTFQPPVKISDQLINEARIVHVVRGRSHLFSANHRLELEAGDTLVMKADNFINHWQENEDNSSNQVIAFQLSADFLRHLYGNQMPEWFQNQRTASLPPAYKAPPSELLQELIRNLQYYFDHPRYLSEELIQLKARELIFLLIETDPGGRARQLFGKLFQANEYHFQDIIQTHLFEDLRLEDLAFLAGLSVSSFKRKFKSIYGSSPSKYIVSKRLEKAQTLLSTTDLRISDVAYDCGFNDVGYFSKTFRQYYELSPSEFRQQSLS